MGVREPESLEAWEGFALGSNNLPWLRGRTYNTLQRSISYFLLDDQMNRIGRSSRSSTVRRLSSLLRKPLLWRIKRFCFAWPFELWLAMVKRWLVVRRSLLTGQPLSRELTE